jgi:hypothetical protein
VAKLLNEILKNTEKIPQLRQELERMSKRTDQLEAWKKPRRVTQEQVVELHSLLSRQPPHPIEVTGLANNVESMQYAEDLARVLQISGWPVKTLRAAQMIGTPPVGLYINYKDEEGAAANAQFLAQSFRKVGIYSTVQEKPKRTSSTINIIVGSKPD